MYKTKQHENGNGKLKHYIQYQKTNERNSKMFNIITEHISGTLKQRSKGKN